MAIVVTTLTREHIEKFGIKFPESWEIRYVGNITGDRYVSNLEQEADMLIKACVGADFLLVSAVYTLPRRVIENIPSVKFIQVEGVAYHRMDFDATVDQKIPLCNSKGANAISVAEFAIGMMITIQRRLLPTNREIKAGNFVQCQIEWRSRGSKELCSSHVGIIGLGDIGKNVARMLKPFNCQRVSYYDIVRPDDVVEKELNVHYLPMEELLKECDIVTVHVPVTKDTVKFISTKELALMKPTAILMNTARGEVVDQAALANALENGKLYGVGTDVYDPEPPASDYPLLHLSSLAADKLYMTPHVAGTTDESYTNMLKISLNNMKNVLDGKPLTCVVNGITKPRV